MSALCLSHGAVGVAGRAGHRRWLLVAFLSLHGMATEYVQTFVPDRYGSWTDVGIDHIGIALGLALSRKWWRR